MARHGVEYETVKQAALKLLSQGISPSIQKIRELLGTGSNTTIAEHLKFWRDEHAAKKVYHLPATIPEELIVTFETLWQTAMQHAEQHMSHIKQELDNREVELQQEKTLADKTMKALKLQLDKLSQKIDIKMQENQELQTQLAVINERFDKKVSEIDALKQQHELQLKHLLDEKHQAIEKVNYLENEVSQHQQSLSDRTEKYQLMIEKERALQEDSEKRWAQLIDQARLETNEWRKKSEEVANQQNDKIESLKNNLIKLQDKFTAAQTALNHKNDTIDTLNKQIGDLQAQHTVTVSEFAVLKARFKTTGRKSARKLAESV